MPTPAEGIIDVLQRSLSLHWTAIENYVTQSKHYETWGYKKLAEKYSADAEEERGHAAKLLGRIEYFNVTPGYGHNAPQWPRHDYVGALDANYALETGAADVEREGYQIAIDAGDAITAGIFESLLEGSEGSIIEIEALREVIGTIGLDNFLANQA